MVKIEKNGLQILRCLSCVFEILDMVQVGNITERKCKSRVYTQYYCKPFAPQNYSSRNALQHAASWTTYAALAPDDNQVYFADEIKRVN